MVTMIMNFKNKSLFVSRNHVKTQAAIIGNQPISPIVFTRADSISWIAIKKILRGMVNSLLRQMIFRRMLTTFEIIPVTPPRIRLLTPMMANCPH